MPSFCAWESQQMELGEASLHKYDSKEFINRSEMDCEETYAFFFVLE
jgi:hypothetical protein